MIKLTEKQIESAQRLHNEGMSWKAIAGRFGCTLHEIQFEANPEYRSRRNSASREARRRERANDGRAPKRVPEMTLEMRSSFYADAAARLAEIPPDTRSLTARIFGDPIPGDMRRHRVLA